MQALQRYGLAYVEDTHPPGFHRPAAKRVGGRRATPCLGLPTGGCVDGSDAILRWVDEQRGAAGKPGLPLYPQEPAAAEEVTRLCRVWACLPACMPECLGACLNAWGACLNAWGPCVALEAAPLFK